MTATTYQHCYRLLQVTGDCEWEELRLAYRRRVRQCHPDLAPAGDDHTSREEEFKRVVLAYRALARFHVRHGELPPPWLVVDDHSTTRIEVPAARTARGPWMDTEGQPGKPHGGFRWAPPRFYQAVFATFVGGVCAAALASGLVQDDDASLATPNTSGKLAVGMDPQSVVELQGVPSYTKGSVWFYGDSGVIFDKGCVVGWENQSPFPLRTLVSTVYFAGGSGTQLPLSEQRNCRVPGD